MQNKRTISQFLKIRESEKRLVTKLFVFQFFQGAAIALFFTASISLFLTNNPASELPHVYIITAILLWGISFVYNKLEHRLSTKNLIFSVLIFNSIVILVFRLFITPDAHLYLYLMLAFYYLLYLLNNLEFWGLVALLFDVRQSKRLFAIVSGGDLPAKMIGYLIAALLVPVFGTENLLWISFACLLISFVIFYFISRTKEFKKISHSNHDIHQPIKQPHHFATEKIKTLIAAISNNKLIRTLSFLSFFSFCFYLIASYVFYGFVKQQFHSDKNMAGFFAIFLAVSRGLTLIVKLVFTSRLLDKLGLKTAMMITPVFLLILSIISFYYAGISSNLMIFYLFGIMAISVDVLRSSIQSPVMLATLQPLPANQRLRGHTLIKGLMDPFAFFITGFVLLFLTNVQQVIQFETLCILLIVLTVLWILFSFFVDKHYEHLLTESIHKRILHERDISITDKKSIQILLRKMESSDDKEALTILHLAETQDIDHSLFFESALRHPSHIVRQQAIQGIKQKGHYILLPTLKEMMLIEKDPAQLANIISTVSTLDLTEDISSFFEHNDQIVINAAVIAIINNPKNNQIENANDYLLSLLNSDKIDHKINALTILKKLHSRDNFKNYILSYLNDSNAQLNMMALELISFSENREMINAVLLKFIANKNDSIYLHALFKSEKACLPILKDYFASSNTIDTKRRKLLRLLRKIGGEESIQILENAILQFPQDSGLILSSLYHLNFHCKGDNEFFIPLLKTYLHISTEMTFQLKFFRKQPDVYSLLNRALEIELDNLKEKCLYIFSFLYDKTKIRKAMAGFELGTKESTANAFELIEVSVHKEFATLFCIIHEPTDLIFKTSSLLKYQADIQFVESDVLTLIMEDPEHHYNDWTKACLLYSLKKKPAIITEKLYSKYMLSKNKLLSETSKHIASFYIKKEH